MPMQITPELREWMKLYEPPFVYNDFDGYIVDQKSNTVLRIDFGGKMKYEKSLDAFGTFIAQQLNELYEQNKEKE